LPSVSAAAWLRFHFGHANQSLRPGDNFDLTASHVIPALMRKAHEAKMRGDAELVIWASGMPRREFLHVDDAADALVHLMTHYSGDSHVNVGIGEDLTILELAQTVAATVGFKGKIVTDPSKPDGTPRKLLDTTTLAKLSWRPKIELQEGLASTYSWFQEGLAAEGQPLRAASPVRELERVTGGNPAWP
jgi:GDP-L-fucose synthase